MNDYDAFVDLLRKGQRFLIVSHYNPDGDGLGASLALGFALERLGKEVVLYNRDQVPSTLAFLPGARRFTNSLDPKRSFDISIMVDCASRSRISEEFANFSGVGQVACLDHHILETPEADVVLIDKGAASTGEVVLRIMDQASLPVDADIAQCIYTTIVVDTGFFRYSNTTTSALSVAARLVDAGAKPWVVAKNLEESHPASRYKLLAQTLSTLKTELNGRYATMDVTQDMLKATGASMELSDEFAFYPRAIEGVEVGALFRETEDGVTKVSLRSKDRVNVAALAKGFGGGGHARAAGLRIKVSMDEAKKKIRQAVEKALAKSS
jgi:phosphoesterase RecJ-like protein